MKFAVFIISHKRADRVQTYYALKTAGYTGQMYVVVDDEDPQLEKYKELYDDELIIFSKSDYLFKVDTIIRTTQKSSPIYARCFVEHIAKEYKLNAFMMIDDDMPTFRYRWVEGDKARSLSMKIGMDKVLEEYSKFIIDNDIAVTSFVHTMFYVAGVHNLNKRVTEQRELNGVFIRNTKFDVDWVGIMRHDMIANLLTAKRGYIWWALPFVVFETLPMNEVGVNEGGMKDTYDMLNHYRRSFLGVIAAPNCCKIGCANGRIKISCDWSKVYPKIISGRYKREG